jgi:hypothetical protein
MPEGWSGFVWSTGDHWKPVKEEGVVEVEREDGAASVFAVPASRLFLI